MFIIRSKTITDADKTDFNDNHKDSTTRVDGVEIQADITYIIWENYTDFKARVTDWTTVKYVDHIKGRHLLYLEEI